MKIVSRAAWGARFAAGAGSRSIPTTELWLHHSVTLAPDLEFRDLNTDSVDDDEAQAMQAIEQIGQQRFGRGFSYNLALMPSGRLYEGCGIRRIGAHTAGRNTRAMGLVLVGNYEDRPMSDPMKQTLVQFLRYAHKQRWIDQPKFDGGHRDLKQTACPGINAYRLISEINRLASSPPSPTPPPTPKEGRKMYFVYSDAGHDWRSDGIIRAPFASQEEKNAWVNDITYYGGTVTRKTLNREQIERLIPLTTKA